MNILLIQPTAPRTHWPRGAFRSRWVPMGPAFLAAALKAAGHSVRVLIREEQLAKRRFDWNGADAEVRAMLAQFRPQMVGFSVMSPFLAETEAMARAAKEICGEETLTVAGGVHPTALPEHTLVECPHIDVGVLGEGERAIVALAEKGINAETPDLAFRRDGKVLRTPCGPVEHNLDRLAPPDYDHFDMAYYTARDWSLVRWLELSATNIRTSRGCTNRCAFCAGPLVSGPGVRFHSVGYVVEQMRRVAERFNVEAVHFEDDTLGADRSRLLELCEAIRQSDLHRRLRWDGCLRADQADAEVLAQMKSAGCIQVEYGFESGSDATLRRIGKNTTAEQNERAARLTHEAGLRVFADIMVGLPDETEADIKATERFLRRIRAEVISFSQVYPLPGSGLFDALPEEHRTSLQWAEFAYHTRPNYPVNLTSIPPERYARIFRNLDKNFIRPLVTAQLLHDAAADNLTRRRSLRRKLFHFALRHPLRAATLPWPRRLQCAD